MPRSYRPLLWLAWVAGLLFFGVPWTSFVGHAHWSQVRWVPFKPGTFRIIDSLLNILYFVGFGWLWATGRGGTSRVAGVILAAAFSVSIELLQVFSHSRIPSVSDVASNTLGAALGLQAASLFQRRQP